MVETTVFIGLFACWLGAILGAAGGLTGVATIASIPKKAEKSEPPVLLTAHDLRH